MKRKLWKRLLSVAIACSMMVTYTVPSFAEDDIGGAPGTSQTEQTDTGETEGETGGDTETDINTEGGNITIEGDTETPAEETPAEETPAEETPAEETPAEETTRPTPGFFEGEVLPKNQADLDALANIYGSDYADYTDSELELTWLPADLLDADGQPGTDSVEDTQVLIDIGDRSLKHGGEAQVGGFEYLQGFALYYDYPAPTGTELTKLTFYDMPQLNAIDIAGNATLTEIAFTDGLTAFPTLKYLDIRDSGIDPTTLADIKTVLESRGGELYYEDSTDLPYDAQDVGVFVALYNLTDDTGTTGITGWLANDPSTWTGDGLPVITWTATDSDDEDAEPDKYNVTSFTDNTGTLTGAVSLIDLWKITAIDISGNSGVTELDIQGNGDLTSIDVTGTSLTHISLGANRSMTDYTWVNNITTLVYLSAWDITFDFKTTFATAIATIVEHRGSVSYDGAKPFWYQFYPVGKPYLDVAVWGNGVAEGQWVTIAGDESGADEGLIEQNTTLENEDGEAIDDGYLPGDGDYSLTYDISSWKADPDNAGLQTLLNQVHVNMYGMYDGISLTPKHIYLYNNDTIAWESGYDHENGTDRNTNPEILESLAYGYGDGWSEGVLTARPAADLPWDKVKVDFTVTGFDTTALGYASGTAVEEAGRGTPAVIDVLRPTDPAITTPFVGFTYAKVADVTGVRLTVDAVNSESGTVAGGLSVLVADVPAVISNQLVSSNGKITFTGTTALFAGAVENGDLALSVSALDGTRFLITKAELLNASGAVISSTDITQTTQTHTGYTFNASDVEKIISLYGLTTEPNSLGWTTDPLTWEEEDFLQLTWTAVPSEDPNENGTFVLSAINDNSGLLTGAVTFPAFENLESIDIFEIFEDDDDNSETPDVRVSPELTFTAITLANMPELTDLLLTDNKYLTSITLTNLPKLSSVVINNLSVLPNLSWLTGISTLNYLQAWGIEVTTLTDYDTVYGIIEDNRGLIDGNGVQPFWYQYVEAERPYITFANANYGPGGVGKTDVDKIEADTELYEQVEWKDDLERDYVNQISHNGRYRMRLNNVDGNGLAELKVAIRGMYKDFSIVARGFRLYNGSQLVYTSPAYEEENWSWYPYPISGYETEEERLAVAGNVPGNYNYGYYETIFYGNGYDNLPAEGRPAANLKWNAVEVDFEVYNYHANLDYASGEGVDKPGRGSPTDLSLYPVTAFNDQWPGDSTYDVGSPFGGMTYDKVSEVTGIRIYTSPVLKDASGNVNLRLDYAVESSVGSTLYTPYGQSAEGTALTEANEYIYEYKGDTPIFTGATASDNVHILINATQFTRFDVMKIELLDVDGNVIATANADDNNPNVTVDHGEQVFIPNKPVLRVDDYARNPVIGTVTDTNNDGIWDETDKIMSGYVQNEKIGEVDYYYDTQMLNNGEYKIKYDFNKAKEAGAIEELPVGLSLLSLGIVGYDNAEIGYKYIKVNGNKVYDMDDNPDSFYWYGHDSGTPHFRDSGALYIEADELTGLIAEAAAGLSTTTIETIEVGFFLKGLPQSLGTYIPGGDERRMVVYDNVGAPGWQEGESFIGVENNGTTTPLTYETAKDITGFHFNIRPLYTDTSDGSLTVYADVMYNDTWGQNADPRNYTMHYTLDRGTVEASMRDGWAPTAHLWPQSGTVFKDMTANDTLVEIRFYGDGAYAIDSFTIFEAKPQEEGGGNDILRRHEAYVNEDDEPVESPYTLGDIGSYGYQYTGNRIEEVFNNNAVIDGNNEEHIYELNVGALIENSYLKQDGISPNDIYGFEIDIRPVHAGGNTLDMNFTTTKNDSTYDYHSHYYFDMFAFRQPQYFRLLDAEWPIFDDETAIFYAGTDDGDAYHIMGLRFLARDGSTIFGMGTLDSWRGVNYKLSNQNGNYLEMTSSINTASLDIEATGVNPADVYGVKVHYSPWYRDDVNTVPDDSNPIVTFQLEAATWTDGGNGDVRDATYYLGTWGTEDEDADDGRTGETRLSDYYSATPADNKFSPVLRDGTDDKYEWWGDIIIDNDGQPLFPTASIGTGKHNKLYFRNDSELYGGFNDFALIGADGEILWWYGGHFGEQQNPNQPDNNFRTFFPLTPFISFEEADGTYNDGMYQIVDGDIWTPRNLYELAYGTADSDYMTTVHANGEYTVKLDLQKAVDNEIITELPQGLAQLQLNMIGLDNARFKIKYAKVNGIEVVTQKPDSERWFSADYDLEVDHGAKNTLFYTDHNDGDTFKICHDYLNVDLSLITETTPITSIEIGYWVDGFEEQPQFHAPYSGASSRYVLYDVSDPNNKRGPFFMVQNGQTVALPNEDVTDVYGIQFAISPRYSVMPDGSQTIAVGLVKNDNFNSISWGDPNQVQNITLTAEDIDNIHENEDSQFWYTFKREDGQPLVSDTTDLQSLKFFFQDVPGQPGSEGAFTIETIKLLTADSNDEDTDLDVLRRTEANKPYDLGDIGVVGWNNEGYADIFEPDPEIPTDRRSMSLNIPINEFFSQTRWHSYDTITQIYGYEVDIRPVFGTNWDVSGDIVSKNGGQEITKQTFNIQAAGHDDLAPQQYYRYTYDYPIFADGAEGAEFLIYAHWGDYFKVAGIRFFDELGNVILGSGTLDSNSGDEYNMLNMGDGSTHFNSPLVNMASINIGDALADTSFDQTDVYGVKFILEPHHTPENGVFNGWYDGDDEDNEDDDGKWDSDPLLKYGIFATVDGDSNTAPFTSEIGNASYSDLLVTEGSTWTQDREQNKLYIVEYDPENSPGQYTTWGEFTVTNGDDPFFDSYDENKGYDIQFHRWGEVSVNIKAVALLNEAGEILYSTGGLRHEFSAREADEPRDAIVLTVANKTASKGGTVSVPITLSNNTQGIYSLAITVNYDESVMTLVGRDIGTILPLPVDPGSFASGNTFSFESDDYTNSTENGTVITLRFEIKEDAPLGNTTISIEGYAYHGLESADTEVPTQFANGTLNITNYLVGDINNDGYIRNNDVLQLRKYIAGGWGITLVDDVVADTNKDGYVRNNDILILRKYIAGGWGIVLN